MPACEFTTRCGAQCISLCRRHVDSASERQLSVRQSAKFVSASERQIVSASERHFVSEMCARGAIVTKGECATERHRGYCNLRARHGPEDQDSDRETLILPPTISTRTPSAAPSCVVPSSVLPLTASVVALWLCLPLSAFPPRAWLLCSRTIHLQPFVNVAGWLVPFADEARSAEVSGIPLPCQPLLLAYGR